MIIASSVSLSTCAAPKVGALGEATLQAMAIPLARGATQSVGVDKLTRRAFLWRLAVVFQRSTREWPLHFALRLTAKHHRDAESVIIILIEHWSQK